MLAIRRTDRDPAKGHTCLGESGGIRMTINRRSLITVLAAGSGLMALPFVARAEGTLEEVKKRGTFRVGVTQAPPWFSKDPKTGEWSSGLGISMGKAMAQALGAKMETVETFKPAYDADSKFIGLNHETIFYDPEAFVAPVRASFRFRRVATPDASTVTARGGVAVSGRRARPRRPGDPGAARERRASRGRA